MSAAAFLNTMEYPVNRTAREKCTFKPLNISVTGNIEFADIFELRRFVFNFNDIIKSGSFGGDKEVLNAGEFNAAVLLRSIFKYILHLYITKTEKDFFSNTYKFIDKEFKKQNLKNMDCLLEAFCLEFSPEKVYKKELTSKNRLKKNDTVSNLKNKFTAFEELILLNLININPANSQFSILSYDGNLKKTPEYNAFWKILKIRSKKNKPFTEDGTDLISFLEAPVKYAPYSLKGQLEFIKQHWSPFIKDILLKILNAEDILSEEQKSGWAPPSENFEIPVYSFENLLNEYEHFTPDKNWMPDTVLIAKSTLVWLWQLSKKYTASITRLDQIPDKEFKFLAEAGINALWLIGIWERSEASRRIKQICGNKEAAASAYSLYDYNISKELGGWEALEKLRAQTARFGIKLAADMVPNHTGLDSKWVTEKPQFFLQCAEPPFPSYNFTDENLSKDKRISVYLEDGYYSKTDCSVVFKRIDNYTGAVSYIYHGNDGTGLPWNDTAQIDFLNAEAREAVIQKIIYVAKNFPIIRFDAAMVLAKKHIRRLWYPAPGKGGDIASRSEYSMQPEEFERKIPEEFWREVVDRCADEVPETLLLAEAFWMMEGYFVRTLGMHRVYNSAFMNMLKNEENAKYRETVKNTLEFDPEVLKRYVNFMNNPDEETAIVQFGSGDKYFGVCTMMCAMPGLPMFGHGQIEGFEEKYGMEFKQAYKNEEENSYLIKRHKEEIFPLLHKRRIFSGVENFRLFDFWNNGKVNENVFAWTNFFNGERSLIFYNNAYESTSGTIKTSAAFTFKTEEGEKILIRSELIDALKLTNAEKYFTVFREQRSKLFFIRKNSEIALNGFFALLSGYQTQVFLNIYETEDIDGSYEELYKTLNGKGIQNIRRGLQKIKLKDLYSDLKKLFTKNYFERLIKIKSECEKTKTQKEKLNLIQTFLNKNETEYLNIFTSAIHYAKSLSDEYGREANEVLQNFKNLTKNFFILFSFQEALNFKSSLNLSDFANNGVSLAYFASLIQAALLKTLPGNSIFSLGLTEEIGEIFYNENLSETASYFYEITSILHSLHFLKEKTEKETTQDLLCSQVEAGAGHKKTKPADIIQNWFVNENMKQYLCINEWDGISWFNKERAENALLLEVLFEFANTDVNQQNIEDINKMFKSLYEKIQNSEYKTENLLKNIFKQ
ncbi:alpha-amylase family glycosyl hydrolase [Treponema pedis]|uniref:Alpha-amylase n=3 Tax=Treponema pedis TaxID=409322 RepID=S5ZRJ3_9SPIR|nr:alpha-amylase family glycosyl hydrolase [Treponema pedis]AGT42640.1 alpha-amylase [Treponema pedis str. T A4]